MNVWPLSTTPDARRLVLTRALRGFIDGAVSVGLAGYLSALGFTPVAIGALVTSTLLGSAALTMFTGLVAHKHSRLRLLLMASALMVATGLGFAGLRSFWPLLLVGFVGTLNPSAGDVSVFLPVEQAMLASTVSASERTTLFALYNLAGLFAGAVGALASALPLWIATRAGCDTTWAYRSLFVAYALVAIVIGWLYRGLKIEAPVARAARRPLEESRAIVLKLAALFSLDAFGGGFVLQSLLALWLWRRFGLSPQMMGTVFFATGVLSALSQLFSARIANRFGLINTMVFTHLPANVFLIVAAFMPTAPLALLFLFLRMCFAQMDVPARQAYVMAVVPPSERAAAASVTNVPRSLAAALAPLIAGALLQASSFGWPLVCGGGAKIVYDLLLLAQFRQVAPHPDV